MARSPIPSVKSAVDTIGDLRRILKLVWSACPKWTALWVVLLVVQGVLPVGLVQLTRIVVDRLAAAVGGGTSWPTLSPVLLPAALMAGLFLLAELLQVCTEWTRSVQSELIQDHIARLVHEKSVSMDIGFFERSEFYDQLHRARADATTRPLAILEGSGAAVQSSVTLAGMAAVLLPYGVWLPPALLMSTVPALVVVLRAGRRYHLWWTEATVLRRRVQYFEMLVTDPYYAGEVRLFGLGGHFQALYQALRRRLRDERLVLFGAQFRTRIAAELVALTITGGVLLWMLHRALLGAITLGDLALFYQAFQRGQGVVRTLLSNLGQIYTNSLYVTNLFRFLELSPTITDSPGALAAPSPARTGFVFRSVNFRYPGAKDYSLKNFTASIPAGKVVALVGENGAGKSTLLKLLARFYDPESGTVELDGIDLRRMSLASLRQTITFMFQEPGRYQLTARENIALGNLKAATDNPAIELAARRAGAEEVVGRLPNGYDSLLGRFFPGGTELSGGEWQRLALARTFVRQGQIVLLDEPTSAMDSWSESDWYDRLRSYARGRTVILATHRFAVAMRADLIYVLKGGHIVEEGSHEELLALDGLYAKCWRAQTETTAELVEALQPATA